MAGVELPLRAWRIVAVLCCAVALLAGSVDAAAAQPVSVTIENLGQPGEVSSVPQPQLVVAERGSCASLFTAVQANGGSSSCPAGSWPPARVDDSSPLWSPALQIAGGDTIRLSFSAPMQDVTVAASTQLPAGLESPAGPVYNIDEIPATHLQSTADPAVWLLPLQQPLADWPGWSFAIVGSDLGGAHDFAAGLVGPRWDDYREAALDCGIAWFGVRGYLDGYTCGGQAIPPGVPHSDGESGAPGSSAPGSSPPKSSVGSRPAPALVLSGVSPPHVVRGVLVVQVHVRAAGMLRANVRAAGAPRLGRIVRRVGHIGSVRLRIRLSSAQRRTAVRSHGRVHAQLDLSFVSGGKASRVHRTLTLPARVLR